MAKKKELERRWVLLNFALPQRLVELIRDITQGYLETGSPLRSLRVRIYDNKEAVITGKDGIGMERDEDEVPAPLEVALMLMRYCHHILMKARHTIGPWVVDVYLGPLSGIVILEFESDDRAAVLAAQPPNWAGAAVEVTDSLTNLHLARMATDLDGTGVDPLAELLGRVRAPQPPKIVITGGPGSGKSTLMKMLRGHYPELQFVPEVASIVIAQVGIHPGGMNWKHFQRTIWRIQKIFEMTSAEFAAGARKKGMVMDRGSVDNAAYFPDGIRDMESLFKTTAAAEYANYDLVLDLAVPPREVYESIKGNNVARAESWEEAMMRGQATSLVWRKHPRYVRIGNDDGWEGKVAAVVRELDRLLHDPEAAHH